MLEQNFNSMIACSEVEKNKFYNQRIMLRKVKQLLFAMRMQLIRLDFVFENAYKTSIVRVNLKCILEEKKMTIETSKLTNNHKIPCIQKYKKKIDLKTCKKQIKIWMNKIEKEKQVRSASIYNNKANIQTKLNRFEEALQQCDYAIYYNPKDVILYKNKAYILTKLNRIEEASQCYRSAAFQNRNLNLQSNYISIESNLFHQQEK